MKRLFWFGAGFAAGVVAYRKANETARQATPAGLASNVGEAVRELASAMGAFGADVRAGMSERELELHELTSAAPGQAGYAYRDEAAGGAQPRSRVRREH